MNDQKSVQELRQRLDENYNAFVQGWLSLDAPALIEKAEEIAATKTVYKAFRDGHFRDIEYLLRFCNPLEVVRDQWIEEENCVPDEELEHILWTISDRGDAEQNYELEQGVRPSAPQEEMKLC